MVAPRVLRNRFVEPALTVGTAIAAEPVNILSGLLQLDDSGVVQGNRLLELFGLEPYEGEATPSQGLRRMEEVGERLTYSPRTPEGQAGLQSLKDAMVNVMDTLGVDEAINYFNTNVVPNLNRAFGAEATKEIGSAILMSTPFVRKVPGIKAYHGSPHDFDEFSMEQIGTGEGAQAYGSGLYFAQQEKIAKEYRDNLTKRDFEYEEKLMEEYKKAEANQDYYRLEMLERAMLHDTPKDFRDIASDADYDDDYRQAAADMADEIEAMDVDFGRIYEVEIDALQDDLLDFDAPLSEQNEAVQDLYKETLKKQFTPEDDKLLNELGLSLDNVYVDPKITGADVYNQLREEGAKQINAELDEINKQMRAISKAADEIQQGYRTPLPGKEAEAQALYDKYDDLMSKKLNMDSKFNEEQKRASDMLLKEGVKGIRYNDGYSRGLGKGRYKTKNYVIFDDRLISISKKYGIAIPAAAVLLSQETGDNPESFYQEDNSV
jgi:hypothetical protein